MTVSAEMYPGPTGTYFSHVPHFLLWLVVSFVVTGCGFLIADAFELDHVRRGLCVSAFTVAGMMIATLVVWGP